MSSSKVCKNLAEEDRRQKALKKEKKMVKKWKWTTTHNDQSFKKEDQLVQGLFRKGNKGLKQRIKQDNKGIIQEG